MFSFWRETFISRRSIKARHCSIGILSPCRWSSLTWTLSLIVISRCCPSFHSPSEQFQSSLPSDNNLLLPSARLVASLVVFSNHLCNIVYFLLFSGFTTFVWHLYNIHMTFLTLPTFIRNVLAILLPILAATIRKLELIQPTRHYHAREPKYFHVIRCYLYNHSVNVQLRT